MECRRKTMCLATALGRVEIGVTHGRELRSANRVCPFRQLLGLAPGERMSPVLEERSCWFGAVMSSYGLASEALGKWGIEVDDSTIVAHVRKAGERAREQSKERVDRALDLSTRAQVVSEADSQLDGQRVSLVLMLDGWMARERGSNWGMKPPDMCCERVAWHEVKSAIVFRLDDRVDGSRPQVIEKFWVAWRGDPQELGRRVHAEALRRGLAQATAVYVVADGGVWIWNIVEDRFSRAHGVLDFYHASQHMWALAHELYGRTPQAAQWVAPLLHQLRHGGEAGVLKTLNDLAQVAETLEPQTREVVIRENNYFQSHRQHLRYAEMSAARCPIGSGAMESTCAQWQRRLKGVGKFWSPRGLDDLIQLETARRNRDWEQIWN